jgi:Tol biopolymer transport system component
MSTQPGEGAPTRWISSSRWDAQPDYSPAGDRIAFASDRSGTVEIWVSQADGTNPVQLTSFGGPACVAPGWSPDGKYLAFTSRPSGNVDVYVVSAQGGASRRLTHHPGEDHTPKWTRDGQWIYFCSNRTGRSELWKTRSDGSGGEVQITRNGGWRSRETADGKEVYYTKFDAPGLWKMATSGGDEELVVDGRIALSWDLAENGAYFVDLLARQVRFKDFRTGKVSTVATPEKLNAGMGVMGGLSISPDGRWLLYVQLDQSVSDLILVENFR